MTKEEAFARQRVIAEAESWIGTPFFFGARVKITPTDKGGVDCAQFIAAVYEACGIFNAEDYGFFGRDWHFNTTVEHYKYRLMRHASQLPTTAFPQMGDIALTKVGKVFSQGGIVTAWPEFIHASPLSGIKRASADTDPMWMGWEKEFFDPFVKAGDV
jgi:cell wall-associated NlpC family hydrolase